MYIYVFQNEEMNRQWELNFTTRPQTTARAHQRMKKARCIKKSLQIVSQMIHSDSFHNLMIAERHPPPAFHTCTRRNLPVRDLLVDG